MFLLFTMQQYCSNQTWVDEEILAYDNRLCSTHCRECPYLKICRTFYFAIHAYLYTSNRLVYVAGVEAGGPEAPGQWTQQPFHSRGQQVPTLLSLMYGQDPFQASAMFLNKMDSHSRSLFLNELIISFVIFFIIFILFSFHDFYF